MSQIYRIPKQPKEQGTRKKGRRQCRLKLTDTSNTLQCVTGKGYSNITEFRSIHLVPRRSSEFFQSTLKTAKSFMRYAAVLSQEVETPTHLIVARTPGLSHLLQSDFFFLTQRCYQAQSILFLSDLIRFSLYPLRRVGC